MPGCLHSDVNPSVTCMGQWRSLARAGRSAGCFLICAALYALGRGARRWTSCRRPSRSSWRAAGGGPARRRCNSWGNGANYQLGTGAEGLQLAPNRLDALHGAPVQALAAAKFHSVRAHRGRRALHLGLSARPRRPPGCVQPDLASQQRPLWLPSHITAVYNDSARARALFLPYGPVRR